MTTRHNVSVQTLIFRNGGEMFADLGTMRWFGVDDDVVAWLAGSCKTTAFWLIGLPEATGTDAFTLKYRTIVTATDGQVESDTTLVEFEGLTYADVIRFERWALHELEEMIRLFESKRSLLPATAIKRRSKLVAVFKLLRQWWRNKRGGVD